MNKKRKRDIMNVVKCLREANANLEDIKDAEQDSIDGTPETLQGSERCERSKECVDGLEDSIASIETVIDTLENM